MDLFDTADLMCSSDYQKRFKAEYLQLKIRYEELQNMVSLWDKCSLSFKPTCPRATYGIQLEAMKRYLDLLEIRAALEKIDLSEEEE